jgi:outer membrane protein insertion porin family
MTQFKKRIFAALLVVTTATAQAQTTPPPAAAAQSLRGQTVERFEVVGNTSVASDTIRVYLGVVPGQPWDPEAAQANFPNLWQTGLFDDMRIEAERGERGVVVRVIVKERPRIGAVEFRGNKNLQTAKINEALDRAKIDVHVGNTIEQTLIRRAAETIKNAYTEGGFEGVSVETRLEDMTEPTEKKIVFQVTEGIKAKVAKIDFVGNKRFSDRRLRSTMKEVKQNGIISMFRKKNLYIPSKLDEDLEKIKNLYQDYGYKDIEFGDPEVSTLKGRKPRVKVTIPVREGEIHKFGEVTIEGNKVFTSEQMIGNWPLKKGEVLSRKPIQGRLDFFEELYRRRGYIYAYINPEYKEREDNIVDVNIQVFEGDQFKLGRLEFEGNTVTKDKVLRREIFLEEGTVMDMETFKSSLYKLGQLGYFKVTENPDFKVNQEQKTVDVTIKGQEEGKNDVQFGGGYSETYGFFGQFQFSTRNLLGEGEGLGLSFQRGARQNFYSFSYTDPWFMDRPHSLGISIYDRETTYPDAVGFNSRGKGGSVAYGYRVGRFESVSMLYAMERRRDHVESNVEPDDNGNIPLPTITDEKFTTSAFVPSYRYDSRDNPYDTMRGTKFSASASYEGGPLGGTVNLLKPVVNFTRFQPLSRRSSLSFNTEAGQIFPLDDDCSNSYEDAVANKLKLCVPRSERFFVGGEYSVRGFRSYSIGPNEKINNQDIVVGGYKYAVVNAEYIYRVNDPLRVVLFADAGNAMGYKENWDFGGFRYSVGAEMRVFLPVFQFPLRFIYSFNPDKKPGDRFEAFAFSVGNTF